MDPCLPPRKVVEARFAEAKRHYENAGDPPQLTKEQSQAIQEKITRTTYTDLTGIF